MWVEDVVKATEYESLNSLATGVPPLATVYQRYSPGEAPDVVKVNVAPLQKGPLTVGVTGSVGMELIVAITAVRGELSHIPSFIVT